MDTVITALTDSTNGITGTNLWSMIGDLVPLIVVLVVFALGLTFLRRAVKGASHGKARF
jgi:hypothetical protein